MSEKIKLKEWQDQILSELSPYLPKYGFNPKPNGHSFYREMPYGWDYLHINFSRYTSYLTAAVHIGLRLDALEDLMNECDPLRSDIPNKEKRHMASIGGEIGNLSIGKCSPWKAESPDEIPHIAVEIIQKLEEIGLPYFAKYADMEVTYQTLVRHDREGWKHSTIDEVRCKRAIGLAYLLGKPNEELESLIEHNEAYLREKDNANLESYIVFASAIRNKKLMEVK